MKYTKDNINNLKFNVPDSLLYGFDNIDNEYYTYTIEFIPESDYCTIHWTEDNKPNKTDYLLFQVLNYLNSGDWVVSAPEKK